MFDSDWLAQTTAAVRAALVASLIAASTPSTSQSDFNPDTFLKGQERKALISLKVGGVDSNGKSGTNYGTAFFISPDGFALTAAHLFFSGRDVKARDQEFRESDAAPFVEGRIGSGGAAYLKFQPVLLFPEVDLALIQLFDPAEPMQYLRLCSQTPPLTERLHALGFIAAQSLTASPGTRYGSLVGQRYPTNININPGLSGAPIVNAKGEVFGVALAGVREKNFEAYNFFLPVQFFSGAMSASKVKEDCGGSALNAQRPVGSITVARPGLVLGERIAVADGFSNFGASFMDFRNKRVVSWGDLSGDLGVATPQLRGQRASLAQFFLPYDSQPYPDSRKARGGIAKAPIQDLSNVDDCQNIGYQWHWEVAERMTVYCVRTRDGKSFAKIKTLEVNQDQVVFEWIYQPLQ